MTSTEQPSVAQYPFDNADSSSDVIFRTSDNIDYYLHKLILKFASPVFADMFNVAQPVSAVGDPENSSHGLPVILITEKSRTLDCLLRMCYPVPETEEDSLAEVEILLKAALKYQVEKAVLHTNRRLVTFTSREPLSVFAIACRLNQEQVACVAAQAWKQKYKTITTQRDQSFPTRGSTPTKCTITSWGLVTACDDGCLKSDFSQTAAGATYNEALHTTTAGQFYRLLRYLEDGPMEFCCSTCKTQPQDLNDVAVTDLLSSYPFSIPDSDFVIRSRDGIEIPVHKLILSIASAHTILGEAPEGHTENGSPIVRLDQDGEVLATLVRSCYPFGDEEITEDTCGVSLAASVRRTAETYEMHRVAQAAKYLMIGHTEMRPLQVYFAASRYGWKEEVDLAAQCCLSLRSLDAADSYVSEMEHVSSDIYYQLLKRHHSAGMNSAISEPVPVAPITGNRKKNLKKKGRR
ncbi:unnamed protein product [Somion occarium]|uniref:BTB domain-containing protein n=1 Tax=Somion occarium TaxID=3059160 RepID=A0ABP1E9N6_9APHY